MSARHVGCDAPADRVTRMTAATRLLEGSDLPSATQPADRARIVLPEALHTTDALVIDRH